MAAPQRPGRAAAPLGVRQLGGHQGGHEAAPAAEDQRHGADGRAQELPRRHRRRRDLAAPQRCLFAPGQGPARVPGAPRGARGGAPPQPQAGGAGVPVHHLPGQLPPAGHQQPEAQAGGAALPGDLARRAGRLPGGAGHHAPRRRHQAGGRRVAGRGGRGALREPRGRQRPARL